jgi:uncharacterized protein
MKQFTTVTLWGTNKCNLHCAYCFQARDKPSDMSVETLVRAVGWMRANGVGYVDFFGAEPLMNTGALKAVIAAMRCRVGITTNGTLLNPDIYDWLRLFNVNINLSMDGSKRLQDKYRDNSYDMLASKVDLWKTLPVNVLMTNADPLDTYEAVSHIKSLGFHNCFLNMLDPYGFSYSPEGIKGLEKEYVRTIRELHHPPDFSVNDYPKWRQIAVNWKQFPHSGCGVNKMGLCIGVDGRFYGCHRAVELGPDYSFGDVWSGIDERKEEAFRKDAGQVPKKCQSCNLGCLPCPISSHNAHGRFGVDPEDWFCDATRAKIHAVEAVASS